jgi:two-component sensor histidine kinase
MQVIGALMSLQASVSDDEKLASAISDTQDRIRAMALVHEKLYRTGNFSSLGIRDYFEDLLKAIFTAQPVTDGRVRTETNLEDISVSIDAAVPLGLIINELVSNSLKHAFPGPKSGTIFLSLKNHGERAVMRYRDDGPGLPPGLDLSGSQSLGLRLVHNLSTLQLRGTMEVRRDPVTEIVFTFDNLTH